MIGYNDFPGMGDYLPPERAIDRYDDEDEPEMIECPFCAGTGDITKCCNTCDMTDGCEHFEIDGGCEIECPNCDGSGEVEEDEFPPKARKW